MPTFAEAYFSMPPEVEDYDFKGVTAVYTFTQGVRKV
jgi:hypothetical protein